MFHGKLKFEIIHLCRFFFFFFLSAAVASGQPGRVDSHKFLFNLRSEHRKTGS